MSIEGSKAIVRCIAEEILNEKHLDRADEMSVNAVPDPRVSTDISIEVQLI